MSDVWWIVLSVTPWEALSFTQRGPGLIPVQVEYVKTDDEVGFIRVFETREAAEAYADGKARVMAVAVGDAVGSDA